MEFGTPQPVPSCNDSEKEGKPHLGEVLGQKPSVEVTALTHSLPALLCQSHNHADVPACLEEVAVLASNKLTTLPLKRPF